MTLVIMMIDNIEASSVDVRVVLYNQTKKTIKNSENSYRTAVINCNHGYALSKITADSDREISPLWCA